MFSFLKLGGIEARLGLIAAHLERIANQMEISSGSKGAFRTFYRDPAPDGSWIGYTDDVATLREEIKMLDYLRSGARPLGPSEAVPGPLNEEGLEWGSAR